MARSASTVSSIVLVSAITVAVSSVTSFVASTSFASRASSRTASKTLTPNRGSGWARAVRYSRRIVRIRTSALSTSVVFGTGVFSIREMLRIRSPARVDGVTPSPSSPRPRSRRRTESSRARRGPTTRTLLPERTSSPIALTTVCVAPAPDGVPTTIEFPATMCAMMRSCSPSASSINASVSRLRVSESPGSTAAWDSVMIVDALALPPRASRRGWSRNRAALTISDATSLRFATASVGETVAPSMCAIKPRSRSSAPFGRNDPLSLVSATNVFSSSATPC